MILMSLLLFGFIIALCALGNDNSEKVMNEFCKLECKSNIHGKYKFCC